MANVRFIHRRRVVNEQIDNNGGFTVAYREIGDGKIEYAFANCSPRDNFSRALGRVKAQGRLDSPHYRCVTDLTTDEFIESVHEMEVV